MLSSLVYFKYSSMIMYLISVHSLQMCIIRTDTYFILFTAGETYLALKFD